MVIYNNPKRLLNEWGHQSAFHHFGGSQWREKLKGSRPGACLVDNLRIKNPRWKELPWWITQGTWPNYDPCRLITLLSHAGVWKFRLQKFKCWGIRYPSRTITVFNIDEYFMAHELTTVAKWTVNIWLHMGTCGRSTRTRWRSYENPASTKQSAPQGEHQKLTLVYIHTW